MKLPFRKSTYLWGNDGYFRMFVRWLYHKVLNEPFIPDGTTVYICRKPQTFKKDAGKIDLIKLTYLRDPFFRRRGQLEDCLFKIKE